MFKKEKKELDVILAEDEERYRPIKQKVELISNLSNTMDTFIGNLIEEMDESRGQMFDILENIAYHEAKKDIKQFSKNYKNKKDDKRRGSLTNILSKPLFDKKKEVAKKPVKK